MDEKNFTVKDLETKVGIDYAAANGVISFLKAKGYCEPTGAVRKLEGAKGKGSTLYRLTDAIPAALRDAILG